MKKLFTVLLIMTFLVVPFQVEATSITLRIDGVTVSLGDPVLIISGRSFLPMRSLFEAVGAAVDWDQATERAIAEKHDRLVEFTIGSTVAKVNGEAYSFDTFARIVNGRTYIPIRAAGETLGYEVDWDPSGIVLLYSKDYVSYDLRWWEKDRSDFDATLTGVKNLMLTIGSVYEEYKHLLAVLERLQSRAYFSPRGYSLYCPDLTMEVNTVEQALVARSLLLKDMQGGSIGDLAKYYPSSYLYSVTGSYRSVVAQMNSQGDSTSNYVEIKHTAGYRDFDLTEVIAMLENVDIPDFYLKGTRIVFVKGSMQGINNNGFNNKYLIRGSYSSVIAIFDQGQSFQRTLNVLAHELGHNVEAEFLNSYTRQEILQSKTNEQLQSEYLALYENKYSADDNRWSYNIKENMTEDFAWVYFDKPKQTAWTTNATKADIRAFFERNFNRDYTRVPTMERLKIIDSHGTLYHHRYIKPVITDSHQIVLEIDGLYSANQEILATVLGAGTFTFNGNRCTVVLPGHGDFTIYVGISMGSVRHAHVNFGIIEITRLGK